eukprot:TRINITY_DN4449_c0_g1_i2.p1 TRINITY_DN4449_c0_g1~~TRINITY_DN4449_c0_g1_i2.p1  ORF type:complete len:168 (+),score=38.81 TRINITY_DN4449_c0_g1_i2:40-543(+)
MRNTDHLRCTFKQETVPPLNKNDTMDDFDSVLDTIQGDQSAKRHDGRVFNQFRQMFIKTGVVSQASGSSYIEMNNTKVICAVYGPKKSDSSYASTGKIECSFKYATFAKKGRRMEHRPNEAEQEIALIVSQSISVAVDLAKYPKSIIDINIIILECDGSEVSTASLF